LLNWNQAYVGNKFEKNRKPMLYVKLRKALYRTPQAALLFWKLLSDTLIEWSIKLNEYSK